MNVGKVESSKSLLEEVKKLIFLSSHQPFEKLRLLQVMDEAIDECDESKAPEQGKKQIAALIAEFMQEVQGINYAKPEQRY